MGGGRALPRFFIDRILDADEKTVTVEGEDAHHIGFSLRARVGETYTLCDAASFEYESTIESITSDAVTFHISSRTRSLAEPDIDVTLYQAFVKGDKLDDIVQKAVELGVKTVVPVEMRNCVSRPDEKSARKKTERLNKIAKAAAMQSMRGAVPTVGDAVSFRTAIERMKACDIAFVCYETTPHVPLRAVLRSMKNCKTAAVLVGPEGGIDESEANAAKEAGIALVSLGSRILRTETAPLAALAALMYETGNLD